MSSLNRRDFLKTVGAASLAASFPALRGQSAPASAQKNPVILFSKHANWLTAEELGPYLRDLGFDGVELAVRPGGHVLPAEAARRLPAAVKAITSAGLSVPNMVSGITDADDLTETVLRAAADSGIKHYRLAYYDFDPALGVIKSLDKIRARVEKLAKLNEKIGIHGAWQNHDGVRPGASIWEIWYAIKDLDPRWMGVQFDPRHATVEGGHSWVNDFDVVKPWVRCSVAKDFVWEKNARGTWTAKHVPLGEGMVDFDLFYKRYLAAGLSGPVSMHVEFPMFTRDEKSMSKAELSAEGAVILKRELTRLRGLLAKAGVPA
ncbi:MAG TPA: TIM barrel protein [Opitutaceae bacterium]